MHRTERFAPGGWVITLLDALQQSHLLKASSATGRAVQRRTRGEGVGREGTKTPPFPVLYKKTRGLVAAHTFPVAAGPGDCPLRSTSTFDFCVSC